MTSQQPGQHVASYYGSQTQFPGQQLGRPSTYYSQALNAAQPQAYPGALFVCNTCTRKNAGSSASVNYCKLMNYCKLTPDQKARWY